MLPSFLLYRHTGKKTTNPLHLHLLLPLLLLHWITGVSSFLLLHAILLLPSLIFSTVERVFSFCLLFLSLLSCHFSTSTLLRFPFIISMYFDLSLSCSLTIQSLFPFVLSHMMFLTVTQYWVKTRTWLLEIHLTLLEFVMTFKMCQNHKKEVKTEITVNKILLCQASRGEVMVAIAKDYFLTF